MDFNFFCNQLIIRQADISDTTFLHRMWSNDEVLKKYLFLVKHDCRQQSQDCLNFLLYKFNNEMKDESVFKIFIIDEVHLNKKQTIGYIDIFIPYLKNSDTFAVSNCIFIDDVRRSIHEDVIIDSILNLIKEQFWTVKYLYLRNVINISLPFKGKTFFMGKEYYKFLIKK